MAFNEDAGCANPCGMEPMGCAACPELGNSGPAHDKAYYQDAMRYIEDDLGIDMDDPMYDDILSSFDY